MLPYGRQSVSEEDVAAVAAVLSGDWLTTGPHVAEFESAISAMVGGHRAVSCTSGTAALHIAYAALGLGPGDEVVTTPMTFVATASTASLLGATIVFADVEEDTALIDPGAVSALVGDRTRVVAAVDYAGHPCDYDRLNELAAGVGAVTLADAAHSVGVRRTAGRSGTSPTSPRCRSSRPRTSPPVRAERSWQRTPRWHSAQRSSTTSA